MPIGIRAPVPDGVGGSDTYTYDAAGRLATAQSGDMGACYTYDDAGRLTLVEYGSDPQDPDGAKVVYAYDDVDRPTDIEHRDGNDELRLHVEYDWNLDNTVQERQETEYDANGLLLHTAVVVTYDYDDAGNLIERVDQRGIETDYTYNDLHQLTQRAYTDGGSNRTEYFTFDLAGRLLTAANDISEVEFEYDAVGRLAAALQVFTADEVEHETTYDYVVDDQNPLQREITYPGGRAVTATLDGRSRLESIYDDSTSAIGVEWAFDAGNRRDYALLSNGVVSVFDYDLNNRLEQIQHTSEFANVLPLPDPIVPSDPFYDVEYGYDAVGNRLWKWDNVETDRSETYAYDGRYRLIGFKRGTMYTATPEIETQTTDDVLPKQQDWLDLDRRGNWIDFHSTVDTATTEQDRTLADPGGAMNEYDRIEIVVGTKEAIQQLTYDDAGNLIASDAIADMNCDGAVDFFDIDPFAMAVTNPTLYEQTYPDCAIELGDINGDGDVNSWDLDLFAALLNANLVKVRRYVYDEENRLTAVTEIDDTPLLEMDYDALGRRIATRDYADDRDPWDTDACGTGLPTGEPLETRHVYSGVETIEEYVWCEGESSGEWKLAREFLWGEAFPEPLVLIDWTDLGDEDAGTEEVLHYVHDALGSVVGLTDAGDPDATPEPVPPKLVERYDYDPYGKTYIESWDATKQAAAGVPGLDADTPPRPAWGGARQRRS